MSAPEVSRKLPDVSISFNSLAGGDVVSTDLLSAEQSSKKPAEKAGFFNANSVPEHTINQPIPSVSLSFGSSVNSLAAIAEQQAQPSSTKSFAPEPVQHISKPIPDIALSFTLSADKLAELAASASSDKLKGNGTANAQSVGLEPTAEGDENDSVSGDLIDVGIDEQSQPAKAEDATAKQTGNNYRLDEEEKAAEKDGDGFIEIQLENVNEQPQSTPALAAAKSNATSASIVTNSEQKPESNVSVTRQTITDQIEYDQDGFPIIKTSQQQPAPKGTEPEPAGPEEAPVDPSVVPLTSFKRETDEPDEFDAVWKQLEQPARKMLKPSKKQVESEHKAPEPVPQTHTAQPSADPKPAEGKGMQTGVLDKLNLKPTSILDAYKGESQSAPAQPPVSSEAVSDPLKAVKDEPKEAPEAKEWDQITELRQKQLAEKAPEDGKAAAAKPSAPPLAYDGALKFLMGQDLSDYQSRIVVKDLRKQGCFANLMSCITGGPALSADLSKERDAVFAFALMALEESVPEHERMLQTLYKTVTGDKLDCPRFGKHWELIGFQGNDPATDLRGSGLLGLLQLLFLFKAHRALALRIHQLSKDDVQNFPFAVVSLNITGIVLQTLRETRLYDDIKKRNSVLEVINELYAAAFYEFFVVWKREGKTVADFGAMKKRLAASVAGAPDLLVAGFRKQNSADVQKEKLEFSEIP